MSQTSQRLMTLLVLCFSASLGLASEKDNSLLGAFENGKFKGQVGLYYEVTDFRQRSAQDSKNESYSNAYLQLKYETAQWNQFQIGAELFAASEITDRDQSSNPAKPLGYQQDFEDSKQVSLSELYLKYNFAEKSYILIGRYNHKKITHIDDSHSEGFYLAYNEVKDLKVIAGLMTRFAELDYDDFEDFGQAQDKQDLGDNAAYGDASPYLVYLDVKYKINDSASVNPYAYFQNNYAAVYGSDLSLKTEISEELSTGLKSSLYYVDDQRTDQDDEDSLVGHLRPWIAFSDLKLSVGYTHFSQGFSKPKWFADYLTGFDQVPNYNSSSFTAQDSATATFFTAEYKFNDFSLRYGIQQWDNDKNNGIDTLEQEIIFGYKIIKNTDVALRLLDVDQGSDSAQKGQSYRKIEARLRYKF